jgi:mono/diheme cytochrome c family protein
MKKALLPILGSFALVLHIATGETQPTPTPQGTAKAGAELYFKFGCYECHGYSGQNGPGTRLVPIRMNVAQFTAYVRNPARMPPYTAKLVTDAQMADIYAYLQSLKPSPPAKDIPLLNRILNEGR